MLLIVNHLREKEPFCLARSSAPENSTRKKLKREKNKHSTAAVIATETTWRSGGVQWPDTVDPY